jgi:subtilisin family serine protease
VPTTKYLSALSAILLTACMVDPAPGPERESSAAVFSAPEGQELTGVHIVQYSRGAEARARAATLGGGGRIVRHLPEIGALYVEGLGSPAVSVVQAASGVNAVFPDVRTVMRPAPSKILRAGEARGGAGTRGSDQSGAQFFPLQWNIRAVRADAAWGPSGGGSGEVACILDTGIDPDHVDLRGRVDGTRLATGILHPRFPSDVTPIDHDYHGTFVAGLVATNGVGVASTAPNARLCAIKVLSQDGAGTLGDVVAGIVQAANWDASVINLSLVAVLDVSEPRFRQLADLVQAAITYATGRGAVVVASAGNFGINFDEVHKRFIIVPAMLGGVLSVGATAPVNQQGFDQLASYSNHGGVRTIDLVAPGGDLVEGGVLPDLIISVCSQFARSLPFRCGSASYLFGSGTSVASPMVAGAVAVLRSTRGPLTPAAIEACLLSSSDRVGSKWVFGAGRLNLLGSLACT